MATKVRINIVSEKAAHISVVLEGLVMLWMYRGLLK